MYHGLSMDKFKRGEKIVRLEKALYLMENTHLKNEGSIYMSEEYS